MFGKANKYSNMLMEKAISMGMCEEGKSSWGKYKDYDQLCEHYWEGIEFIIDHPGFLDKDYMVKTVGKDTLHRHGIFVDDKMYIESIDRADLVDGCEINMVCDNYDAPVIYVRGNSVLRLTIGGSAVAHINVFSGASVCIRSKFGSETYVYNHGGYVYTEGDGKIKVRGKSVI